MQDPVKHRGRPPHHRVACGALSLAAAIGGVILNSSFIISCSNGSATSALTSSNSSNSSITTSGSVTSTTSSTASVITITAVVRDQLDPNGTIDVVGDNTGSIGTYCIASGTGSGTKGPSTCECNYEYTDPDTNTVINQPVPTLYQDSNMLQCSLSQYPPSGVTSMTVSVIVTSDDNNTSNSYTINLAANSGNLSVSSPSTYSQVIRYTCRDIAYIPDLLDTGSGIYDPLQSESTSISYPLDFYATNLGLALNSYAGGGAATLTPPPMWECPSNPINPPAPFHVTIYSESPLNGSSIISGMDSSGNTTEMNAFNPRSTFYLANGQAGVFDVPVNAYVAPLLYSSDGATATTGIPPIGYGAQPIAGTTPGTESCPSGVPIPTGYRWVKVWLFRASISASYGYTSTKLQGLGNIACNNGLYPNASYSNTYGQPDEDMPFNSCFNDGLKEIPGYGSGDCDGTTNANCTGPASGSLDTQAGITGGYTLNNPNPATGLASRFFTETLQCVDPVPSGTTLLTGSTPNQIANLSANYSGLNPTPPIGADTWMPVGNANIPDSYGNSNTYSLGYGPVDCIDTATNATGAGLHDYMNLCSQKSYNPMPYDSSPSTITPTINQQGYDFVFVVTPPTVMTNDMANTSGAIYQQYAPFRYPIDADCGVANPNECSLSLKFSYGIKFYDVGSSGNAPSTGGAESFPICALQPTS